MFYHLIMKYKINFIFMNFISILKNYLLCIVYNSDGFNIIYYDIY